MPSLDSMMISSCVSHQMWTPAWCHWSPSLTSKQAHWEDATHQHHHQPGSFTSQPKYLPFIDCSWPPSAMYLHGHHLYKLSIHFQVLGYLLLATHPPPGRHLATHTAPSFSTFQGSTWHPTVYTQSLWACSTHVSPVLPLLWPPTHTCGSRDTPVLCFLLGQCQRPQAQDYHWILIQGASAAHQHGPLKPTQRHTPAV